MPKVTRFLVFRKFRTVPDFGGVGIGRAAGRTQTGRYILKIRLQSYIQNITIKSTTYLVTKGPKIVKCNLQKVTNGLRAEISLTETCNEISYFKTVLK